MSIDLFIKAYFEKFEVPINSGKCPQSSKKSRDLKIIRGSKINHGTYRLCQSC